MNKLLDGAIAFLCGVACAFMVDLVFRPSQDWRLMLAFTSCFVGFCFLYIGKDE